MNRLRSASATERRRRGAALLFSIIALFALIAAVASTLSLGLVRTAAAKAARENDEAAAIAESGVSRSLYEVRLGLDFGTVDGIGNSSGNVGAGSYAATIAPAFAGIGEYTISSVGTYQGIRRGVSVIIRRLSNGFGFFADTGITATGSLMIDSYDSSLGSYASQVAGGHAQSTGSIGSNGSISLAGSSVSIWGDATPGPTGAVTGSVSGVHGSTAPAAQTTALTAYTYTPPIAASGSLSTTKVFTSGTYRYTQITLSGGNNLTFAGDVTLYCDNKFSIMGLSFATLLPGAKLTIHTGSGDVTLAGGGIVNTSQAPDNLHLWTASATKVTVTGTAAFYGVIHAPHAQFVGSGNAGLFGAVQARSMNLVGGAKLHYDTALGVGVGGFQIILRRAFRP
jgi:hypothetical protein